MTPFNIHFVDPTIPGISGRDLIEPAIRSAQAVQGGRGRTYRALRRALSGLDRAQLRDLGIDRNGA